MNSKIRQLEDCLIAVLDTSDLEAEIKRLILNNLTLMVTQKADMAIQLELRDKLKEAEEPIVEEGEMKDAEST